MTKVAPPPGWGDDDLTAYFQTAYENRYATFHNKRQEFGRLTELDRCFMRIADRWTNPAKMVEPLLFFRCHAAFRAACEHAAAGQIADVYPLLRACLEYAGYALHMSETPGLDETWVKRHDDDASMRAVKTAFTVAKVRTTIRTKNQHAADVFEKLYTRTVDFGGHPNERAITANLEIIDQEESKRLNQFYLQDDPLQLDHALRTCAQTGVCVLEILQDIFPARFELLGVRHELLRMRKGQ